MNQATKDIGTEKLHRGGAFTSPFKSPEGLLSTFPSLLKFF